MKRTRQKLLSLLLSAAIASSWCMPVSAAAACKHKKLDQSTTDTVVTVAATCTTDGEQETTGECLSCHETVTVTAKIKKLGHNYKIQVEDPKKPGKYKSVPNYNSDEYTHWEECTREGCGEKKSVSAHSFDKKASCGDLTCTKCGEPEIAHKWGKGKVSKGAEATCTEPGVMTYTCTDKKCDGTATAPIEALGHSFASKWTKDANGHWQACTRKGCTEKQGYELHNYNGIPCEKKASCVVCKNSRKAGQHTYELVNWDETGHQYACVAEGCEATMEDSHNFGKVPCGSKDVPCIVDGCEHKADVDHTWGAKAKETKKATCTEGGLLTYTCTVKGCKGTKTEDTDPLGHNFSKVGKNAEEHWKICSNKGCKETSEHEIHNYGDIPCDKTAKCVDCGNSRKKGQHAFVWDHADAEGHWYVCAQSSCGETKLESHDFGDAKCEDENVACQTEGCGIVLEKKPHEYGKEKVTRKATCTVDGEKTLTCTVKGCGAKTTEVIEAHGVAIENEKKPEIPATCTTAGKSAEMVCSACGKVVEKQKTVQKLGHDFSGVAWNDQYHWNYCRREGCGLTEKRQAHDYGKIYCHEVGVICLSEGCEHIRLEGEPHAWDETHVTVQPSCRQEGEQVTKCKACGFEEIELLDKLPHTEVVLEGYAATCTEDGLTDGIRCSACEEILMPQEVIPAFGHEASILPAVYPTCTEDGLTEGEQCIHCGKILREQVVIPAPGHDKVYLPTKAPTCTEEGISGGGQCQVCGEFLEGQEVIPALGHDYTPANWYDDEGHWGICSRCGQAEPKSPHTHDVYDCMSEAYCDCGHMKPAGQHSWGEWYYRKEPTCRDGGYQQRECTICHEYEWRDVDALGHTFEGGLYGSGELTHWPKCDRCGIKNAGAERNHDYPEGAVCTEDMTCLTCGYTKPAGEHAFGPYEIFLEATCTKPGIWRATCGVCGATQDTDIYAKQHAWPAEPTFTIPATCTEAGSATYTCARENCDETKTTPIPALGHRWGSELGIIQNATCTEDGLKAAICTTCGDKNHFDPIVIPATGHTKNVGTVITEATCTAKGEMAYVCLTCSAQFTEEIEMLEHQFVDGYCSVCGRSQATEVSTLNEMQALLDRGESVRLTCDIDFGSSSLRLSNAMGATLYLDGHTITASYSAIELGDYDLKIVGEGTISANDRTIYFRNSNGSLTAENVEVISANRASIEAYQSGTEIALTGCTLTPGAGQRAIAASYSDKVSLNNCVIADFMELSYIKRVDLIGCTINQNYWSLDNCENVRIVGGTYNEIHASGLHNLELRETEANPLVVTGRSSVNGGGSVAIYGGTFQDDFYDDTTGDLTINGGTFLGELTKDSAFAGTVTVNGGTIQKLSVDGYNTSGSMVINGGTFGNADFTAYQAHLLLTAKKMTVTGGDFLNRPVLTAEEMDISGASFQRSAELYTKTSLVLGDGITIPTKDENFKNIDKLMVYADGTVTVNGGSYGSGFIGAYWTEGTYTGKYLINGGTFGNPETYIKEAYNVDATTEIRGGSFYGTSAVYVSASLLVDGDAEFVRGTQAFDAYTGTVTIKSYGSCTSLYLTSSTYGTIIIDGAIPADDTINVRGGILILTENADVASNIGQFTTIHTTQQLWVKPGAKVSGNITLENAANCNKSTSGVEPNGIGIAGGEFTGKVEFSGSKTKLEVSGGTFSNFVIGSNLTSSQFKVFGGTFNINVSKFLADGLMCTKNEDGNWVIAEDNTTMARNVDFWYENDSLTFTITPTNNPEGVTAYVLELSDSKGAYETFTATCTPDDLVARISLRSKASYDTLKVTTMLGETAGDVLELDVNVSCTVNASPATLSFASYRDSNHSILLRMNFANKRNSYYVQADLVQKDGDAYGDIIETNYAFLGSSSSSTSVYPGEAAIGALTSGEECYVRACGWYYDVNAAKYTAAVTYYDYSDYLPVTISA